MVRREEVKEEERGEAREKGWEMLFSGRYAHSELYIRSIAAAYGFEVATFERATPRFEQHEPVGGFVFVLRKVTTR